jgi:glycosyltransferase involved in cell wall biosynthesis
MSLRVLLFGTEFPPSAAGTASYAQALATGLVSAGADVRVLTQATAEMNTAGHQGGEIRRIPYTSSVLRRYWRCRQALQRELSEFQPHCLWTTNGMGTRVASLVSSTKTDPLPPMISCVRGSDVTTRFPGRTPTRWLESLLHRRCYRRSSAIAVVSRALCEVAVSKGLPPQHLFLSPPAFDISLSAGDDETTQRSSTTILTVARLQRQKRIDVLLRALAKVRVSHQQVRLVIVGDGPQLERLQKLALDLDLQSHVEFAGPIEPRSAELFKRYREAAFFALASVGEGLGNVFIEAGAFGLATIGCDDGGTPDVVQHEKTGLLVPPDDEDAVAEAMDRLLADADLRQRLGAQARMWIADHFSIESLGRTSYQVAQQVVAGKYSGGDWLREDD